jgi:hypothetical protein
VGQVHNGAQLWCSCGDANSTFNTLETAGVVTDTLPYNIPSFGLCNSAANPQVAAATVAANGVATAQPCIPVFVSQWTPAADGSQVDGRAAIDNASLCDCSWGGTISIVG